MKTLHGNPSSSYSNNDEGLGPKKTLFVIATVIGCIAILWPKVFYPMMFGSTPPKPNTYDKGFRPGGTGLRQERPPHLRPEGVHPAMRERGRAIPNTQTVPIVDRPRSAANPPPRIIDGRPGPIPGMRPPMGAGSVHQPQPKGNSMGFIMPLYTVGIVAFFLYTIMKLIFKKQVPNAPYGPVSAESTFKKEVFGKNDGKSGNRAPPPTLVVTAIQGLIDAADEQFNSQNNKSTELIKDTSDQINGSISNGHATSNKSDNNDLDSGNRVDIINDDNIDPKHKSQDLIRNEQKQLNQSTSNRKKREGSEERAVTVIGMELTASCEGGQKWVRPHTPDFFFSHHDHSNNNEIPSEIHSIYLEGALPHESQILVADSETHTEKIVDAELNGTDEEPAVVLSSKMTLSLISLNSSDENEDLEEDEENPVNEDDIMNLNSEESKVSLTALVALLMMLAQGFLGADFGEIFVL